MGELLPKQRAEAARRGWIAVAAWGVTGLVLTKGLLLALLCAGVAVWLTRSWFLFRAKWGMRF